jgi:sulfoxide reductase heme-binding subunit YedZ
MMLSKRYWARRGFHHLIFAALSLLVVWFPFRNLPEPYFRGRVTVYSAYAALALLALALCIGPWNVLTKKANPVSSDLRRDIGVWAGIVGVFHTCIGLTVHLRGQMWKYFLRRLHPPALQNTMFGFANDTGLIAALLLVGLLLLSNDYSLRWLGVPRWKSLQRWTYVAYALTVAHGIGYLIVIKRHGIWLILFAAIAGAAVVLQIAGLIRRLRGSSPSGA